VDDIKNGNGHLAPVGPNGGSPRTETVPFGCSVHRSSCRPFNVDDVMPIPCRRAHFVVTVDGVPYTGFDNRGDAYAAMHGWRQRWPAIADKHIDLLER
jgi:hypothetical protein